MQKIKNKPGSVRRHPIMTAFHLISRRLGDWFSKLKFGAKKPPWQRSTPSFDIYFMHVMRPFVDIEQPDRQCFRQLEKNVIATTGPSPIIIIFRYISPHLQARLLADKTTRIWLFLDDDVFAIADGQHLPDDYVRRLQAYRSVTLEPLLQRAERILSPSQRICDRVSEIPSTLVPPAMIYSEAALDHHHRREGDRFKIIFSGSRSHLADLAMIAPELRAGLDEHPHWHLTTCLGRYAPAILRVPNATHIGPLAWTGFQEFVSANKFHVAVCPLQQTAFNAARSETRMFDNAALGCAGLYSDAPPYRDWDTVYDGAAGEIVKQGQWLSKLVSYSAAPAMTKTRAENLAQLVTRIDGRGRQTELWKLDRDLFKQ